MQALHNTTLNGIPPTGEPLIHWFNFWDEYYCDQSYKHFTLVNYDSRVVIWGIFKSGSTLES